MSRSEKIITKLIKIDMLYYKKYHNQYNLLNNRLKHFLVQDKIEIDEKMFFDIVYPKYDGEHKNDIIILINMCSVFDTSYLYYDVTNNYFTIKTMSKFIIDEYIHEYKRKIRLKKLNKII